MSAVLEPVASDPVVGGDGVFDIGQKLRDETCGCRLLIQKPQFVRKMSEAHLSQVEELFRADKRSLKGSRKIINSSHKYVQPVVSILNEVRFYVRARTVDYPEQGLRLVRVDRIEKLKDGFDSRRDELLAALAELDAHWDEVKGEAAERLRELYNPTDYAAVPSSAFGMALSFPAIAPDERLKQLNPKLYQQMQQQIAARFEQAVQVAEAQAVEEVNKLLRHLSDRMKPDENGESKILRGSTVNKLHEFLDVFKEKTVTSNEQVEALIAQVEAIAGGVSAEDIRKSDPVERAKLQGQLDEVITQADKLLESMPVREFCFED